MTRFPEMKKWMAAGIPLGLVLLLFPAGCRVTPEPETTLSRHPVRETAGRQLLLASPARLGEEYARPENSVHQAFSWKGSRSTWKLHFSLSEDQQAGFTFRRPFDWSEDPTALSLTFSMHPDHADSELDMTLIGNNGRTRLNTLEPLKAYRISSDGRWSRYAIPLPRFYRQSFFRLKHAGRRHWKDIEALEVNRHPSGKGPATVQIRNLQVVPAAWAVH